MAFHMVEKSPPLDSSAFVAASESVVEMCGRAELHLPEAVGELAAATRVG